jgi:hypothetical protein
MWQRQTTAAGARLLDTAATAEPVARRRDRQLPERGRLVDAGGYRVRVYQTGTSEPCVVIVPGAGDCAASWIPVANQVARFARVISYDRAGLGGSEDGPPATLDRYLTELHAVIGQADADRPLILAGHSLGGLSLREDLLAVQRHQGALMNSDGWRRITPGLTADLAADPELARTYLAEYIAPRRRSVWDALDRGIARGELPPGIDHAFISDLLTGPLFYRALGRGEHLPPEAAERTVDVVLAAHPAPVGSASDADRTSPGSVA